MTRPLTALERERYEVVTSLTGIFNSAVRIGAVPFEVAHVAARTLARMYDEAPRADAVELRAWIEDQVRDE